MHHPQRGPVITPAEYAALFGIALISSFWATIRFADWLTVGLPQ
jgi:hypothetical protein